MRRYMTMALLVLAAASSRESEASQDVRPARPGVIYLQRKKYREAISCFERLKSVGESHFGVDGGAAYMSAIVAQLVPTYEMI